jgi:hypothetical protein
MRYQLRYVRTLFIGQSSRRLGPVPTPPLEHSD